MARSRRRAVLAGTLMAGIAAIVPCARAQMIDRTQAPNAANDGIAKSLTDEIGAGRGDWSTPASASFLINRDPFRAIRRGREIFQRKFTRLENQGPAIQDGVGDINTVITIGAGLPDSRDAPHLFGLGLKEMLADEMTTQLRQIQAATVAAAQASGQSVSNLLVA